MKARIYQAFAGLDVGGRARTEAMYTRWVQRLATREYADELVVLCVALELAVRITIRHMRWGSGLSRRMVLMALTLRFIWATMMCTTCTCHKALSDRTRLCQCR